MTTPAKLPTAMMDDDKVDDAQQAPGSESTNEEKSFLRMLFLGANWTPWLVLSIVYVIYFIAALGLTWLADGAPPSISTHVVAALVFTLACSWNMLHTPSHGSFFRRHHVAVGWTAMCAGVAVVVGGYWIILSGNSNIEYGAQIAFMTTGALQLFLQGLGVYFVRFARQPDRHMMCMTVMFYNSLLLPAINRLPQLLGLEPLGPAWTWGASAIGFVFAFVAIAWNTRGNVLRV
eukprot:CAMPEP_0206045372 /NCGR_PEP_ID=MMETSP1466-20131121/15684_1 /ASSEMBLY_ACC=CAM_ASM_001126 /TAXON_ID=44452 /ORGANISM="Pavlova gyrans, Strain CCMP608" /LENGTH=232 /DNA_ID=CAMNT_0053420307 /DNA_START=28 /DNA_END=726 /DNA_ORIENTATION=-